MYVKEITYTDFNGIKRTEKFYFNLTKAEILDMQLTTTGGMTEYISKIIAAQNTPELISLFKKLILASYGVKSDDGRRFIKNDEVRDDFAQTQAFSDFYMELTTNDEAASDFIKGVLPADIDISDENIDKVIAENPSLAAIAGRN